jgi:hypothetical protein
MMPLAMLLLFLEYKILSNLFIENEDDAVQPLGLGNAPPKIPAGVAPIAKVAPVPRQPVASAVPGRQTTVKPVSITPIPAKPIATKQQAPQPVPSSGPRQSAGKS